MDTCPLQMQEEMEAAIPVPCFPFFSLPLELRRHIYSELLVPSIPSTGSVTERCVLWNDRTGLRQILPVYPQILLASKQTNIEATPILYENNTFGIDVSGVYPYCASGHGSPQFLFRSDVPQRYYDGPGDIYPHCLRWMANVDITISTESIWVRSASGLFFSHIGDLLVEVLEVLAQDDGIQRRKEPKRLLLTIHKDHANNSALDLFPQRSKRRHRNPENFAARKEMTDQIPPLLEAVAKIRKVEIVQVDSNGPMGRIRNIDLKDITQL